MEIQAWASGGWEEAAVLEMVDSCRVQLKCLVTNLLEPTQ